MSYNYSNKNRRRNNNAVYVVLLGISLLAIIVVAGMYLIKEIKDKNAGGQNFETTGAPGMLEQYPTETYPTQPVQTPGTAPAIPVETAPVQTVTEYDLNGDGVAEAVNVVIDSANSQAIIGVGSLGTLAIAIEPVGANSLQHLTVAGINLQSEKRLAAIEYTYVDGGIGLVKCHIWTYANNTFVKTSEILYSGLIGNQGHMEAGIIENRVPEDSFRIVAEENKNDYIYERSRVIADMKDLGIKLPFETAGQYTVKYDRNITFFYDVNIQ